MRVSRRVRSADGACVPCVRDEYAPDFRRDVAAEHGNSLLSLGESVQQRSPDGSDGGSVVHALMSAVCRSAVFRVAARAYFVYERIVLKRDAGGAIFPLSCVLFAPQTAPVSKNQSHQSAQVKMAFVIPFPSVVACASSFSRVTSRRTDERDALELLL